MKDAVIAVVDKIRAYGFGGFVVSVAKAQCDEFRNLFEQRAVDVLAFAVTTGAPPLDPRFRPRNAELPSKDPQNGSIAATLDEKQPFGALDSVDPRCVVRAEADQETYLLLARPGGTFRRLV